MIQSFAITLRQFDPIKTLSRALLDNWRVDNLTGDRIHEANFVDMEMKRWREESGRMGKEWSGEGRREWRRSACREKIERDKGGTKEG